ncbi:MAG: universal stress protein [Gammaproteobacteria bacterium]|jgi:universal stress protein A
MTTQYKHILLALELNPKSDRPLIEKAEYLAKQTKAKITLVHAVEHIGSYSSTAYGIASIDPAIEELLVKQAAKAMEKVASKLNIPKKNQIISIGSAKFVVLEEAEKNKVDLIIIGSRGRHGINFLIGSTANAVLYSAKCDVLASRVK